ncbi:condensation domain-containing protein [Phytomonospora sp. NPDC050363]|uniref:condensation domain-containing protein n=1 Tax=Phytomonospora sp. NPDC050363 TaxID=3155642 RepID=UPI0033C351E4
MTTPTAEEVLVARASFAQERMWMLEQMEDGAPTYNVQVGLRFRGVFDAERLRRALDGVVARHEMLRTTLDVLDGELVQLIAPPAPVPLSTLDLESETDPHDHLARVSRAELLRSFDAAAEPPLRALLVRLGAEEHVLVVTLDHLAADAASLRLLHAELTAGYTAGGAPALPEPPIQYADYAEWQRDWLTGAELARQTGYWRERLSGSEPIPLGVVGPGERIPGSSGRPLPAELLSSLEDLARGEGASLFSVLLAAYGLLLGRHAGRGDLVVGSLLSGRTRTEIEPLIGFFVNTVALRLDLAGHPSYRELIGAVAATTLDAHAHQDAPFEHVVAEINPPREPGRQPFFNVMFQLVDIDRAEVELPGTVIEPLAMASEPPPVDLVLTVMSEVGGHQGVWDYDGRVLSAEAVAVLQDEYRRILEEIAADPDRPVAGPVEAAVAATPAVAGDAAARPVAVAPVAEVSPMEAKVAAVWEDVLQRPGITAGDDFFDLGGHSLAATRMIIRLRSELGVRLPVRLIFDRPTLGGFAAGVTALVDAA